MADYGTNAPIVTPPMRANAAAPALVAPNVSTTPVFASPVQNLAPPVAPIVVNRDSPVNRAQTELNRLNSTGSGIDQIHNPLLRGMARAADITTAVAGTVFAPLRVASALTPGTAEHHNYLTHQAENRLFTAQKALANDTAEQDAQAQVQQREALAEQEKARAEALSHPQLKQNPGKFIVAGDGSAAGWQDSSGVLHSLDDPSLPQSVRDVGHNMAGKPVNTPSSEKPIGDEEAKARNALWDALAKKHGLPVGQFTSGMSRAEANALAGNLGTVVGKQQGDTHIIVQQAAADKRAANDPAVEREYQAMYKNYNGQLDASNQQLSNIDEARRLLQSGATGQALGTIKTLASLAGGKGTGVRITQAELNALANARGIAGSFESAVNSAAGKGKMSSTQLQQLTGILDDAAGHIRVKQQRFNQGLDRLGAATSREELRRIDSELRSQAMGSIEPSGGNTPPLGAKVRDYTQVGR